MNNQNPSTRRAFLLKTGMLGAAVMAAETQNALAQPASAKPSASKLCYSDMLPYEFRACLAKRPIAYLPLGTLEWHGEHIALGADAIQSEALMKECARRFGGIVMPPIHLGPDSAEVRPDGTMLLGMDRDGSTKPNRQLDGSCYWIPGGLFSLLLDSILTQLKRAGFKAVFADGHGPSRGSWVDGIPDRQRRFGMKLFGVTREMSDQLKSTNDHAALDETSVMMHIRADLVELSRLPKDRSEWPQGVLGLDPRDASAAHGKECFDKLVKIVGEHFDKAGLLL